LISSKLVSSHWPLNALKSQHTYAKVCIIRTAFKQSSTVSQPIHINETHIT